MVEQQIVILQGMGSNPIYHPKWVMGRWYWVMRCGYLHLNTLYAHLKTQKSWCSSTEERLSCKQRTLVRFQLSAPIFLFLNNLKHLITIRLYIFCTKSAYRSRVGFLSSKQMMSVRFRLRAPKCGVSKDGLCAGLKNQRWRFDTSTPHFLN